MLFEYSLKKTKDGVFLTSIKLIPTWVNKYPVNGRNQYTIYPIEDPNDLSRFGLSTAAVTKAQRSYERTKAIVSEGLTECQIALGCETTFK